MAAIGGRLTFRQVDEVSGEGPEGSSSFILLGGNRIIPATLGSRLLLRTRQSMCALGRTLSMSSSNNPSD